MIVTETPIKMPYLQRPLIPDVKYEITDDTIKISSPHTLYVHMRQRYPRNQADLLALYKTVHKQAWESL